MTTSLLILGLSSVTLAVFLLMSRGLRSVGTVAVTGAITAISYLMIFLRPDDILIYNFLCLPVIIVSILQPTRNAALITSGILAGALLLTATRDHGPPTMAHAAALVELSVIFALILVIGRQRNIEEHDRQKRLSESEQNLRALADSANVGILVSFQTRHVFANQMAAKLLRYTVKELLQTSIPDIVHPKERDRVSDRQRRRSAGDAVPSYYETLLITKDGTRLPVMLAASRTTWMGHPASMVFFRDITEDKRAEAQMRKLSRAIDQAADAVMITDKEGNIEYINPAFTTVTGYTPEDAIGKRPDLKKSDKQGPAFYSKLWETILSGEIFSDVFINRRKDGTLYYEEQIITPLRDDEGNITHFVSTGRDISERMAIQERLQHMAHHDALTELPNRALFIDRLKQALARARWHNRIVAVMFLDLDRFKQINDSLGHEIGDRLLGEFARRIEANLREGDTVARFGGDEFVILLNDLADVNDISEIAEKTLATFNDAFHIAGRELNITASIGISVFPDDGEESKILMQNADTAMYRAKETGKNNYQFYSKEMSQRALLRLTMENALRHALKRGEFSIHYQPVINLNGGRAIGAEALLRWNNPEHNGVSPAEFIPLLEDTGLILTVGKWVLYQACKQAVAWNAVCRGCCVSVNLSGRQLATKDIVKVILGALEDSGLPPRRLVLEITESFLMHNIDPALTNLNHLSERGIGIAIDDFGIGYSSLSYLKRLPISILKIDQSFIRDLTTNPDDASIVSATFALATNLNLDVVAEGVETDEQLHILRSFGCVKMQGYRFSRPVPESEIADLMAEQFQIPSAAARGEWA
jgi:diguanylate cyclase (GGDEF)-like protein/PAS domain S-box-containing protein